MFMVYLRAFWLGDPYRELISGIHQLCNSGSPTATLLPQSARRVNKQSFLGHLYLFAAEYNFRWGKLFSFSSQKKVDKFNV